MKLLPYLAALPLTIAFWSCAPAGEGTNDSGGGVDSGTDAGMDPDVTMGTDSTAQEDSAVAEDVARDTMAELFPDGLECPTFSMCSTYAADPSRVPFPEADAVGTLRDGLYRPVQGTSLAYVLAISDGKWARIMPNLSVQYGDIEVTSDSTFRTTRHTVCANGVLDDEAYVLEQDYFFTTNGDEMITYSGCMSADREMCNSPVRLLRVNSLCDDLDDLQCEDGSCNCVAFTDVIPERPEGDTCEF